MSRAVHSAFGRHGPRHHLAQLKRVSLGCRQRKASVLRLDGVTVLVAVAAIAVLSTASFAATWEVGFPYQFSGATDVISAWASGFGVSVAVASHHGDRLELGARVTYRRASYGDAKPIFVMIPEEVLRDYWGDETDIFTGAVFVRVPSPEADAVYLTFAAGVLKLDIGDTYWTTEDVLNAPGQIMQHSISRDAETLAFATAGVGIVLPEIHGARLMVEVNGGFISGDNGYWVTVGPYVRFGG